MALPFSFCLSCLVTVIRHDECPLGYDFFFPMTIKTTYTGSGQILKFSQTLINVEIHPTYLKFSQSQARLGEYHPLSETSPLSIQIIAEERMQKDSFKTTLSLQKCQQKNYTFVIETHFFKGLKIHK